MTKNNFRYWLTRVFQHTHKVDGARVKSPDYSIRFQLHGKRRNVPLKTSDKERAARRARDLYALISEKGWSALDEMRSPTAQEAATPSLSLGAFLDAVAATTDLAEKTWKDYSSSLRRIASEALNVDPHDKYSPKGNWRERVDSIKLSALTPSTVQAWKVSFVNSAEDPETARRRRSSCNSYLRNARALFAPKVLKHLDLSVSNPFAGVDLYPRQSHRYISTIDPETLLANALKNLPHEELKIFLLALMLGLRKKEIDALDWSLVDFERGQIVLRNTKHLRLKSETSGGVLPVDADLLDMLRKWKKKSVQEFVVTASEHEAADGYRCERVFERLYSWLRAQGITAQKPLHELRKEYGALLCKRHGIFAASRLLRHSDIAVTNGHYAASPDGESFTTGLKISDG